MAETLTVGEALNDATRRLAESGVRRPRLDAELMLAHAMGVRRERVFGYPEKSLTTDDHDDFARMVSMRQIRQPLAQVIGYREFWSRRFRVTSDTLCPRPDSETLIEAALDNLSAEQKNSSLRILDLGTGSGCLMLSLLAELPEATGVGVDINEAAIRVALANAEALGLAGRADFVVGDWSASLNIGPSSEGAGFNLIVTNPPYVSEREIELLAPEIARHEPAEALSGGEDGLCAYRDIAPALAPLLSDQGIAVLEVGEGQAPMVASILRQNGLKAPRFYGDLSGVHRCIVAKAT